MPAKYALLLIALVSFVSPAVADTDKSCKAKTSPAHLEHNLHPTMIANFAKANKSIESTGDLMCCITKHSKDLKIVIMNNSLAAQNGTPNHPRVLVVKTTPDGMNVDTVMSVNSGSHPQMSGSNSL